MLDSFVAWLASAPPGILYGVLALLSAIENVFPPVPADVAVAFGAFLSQRGATHAATLGAVCWVANTASAAAMYFLARKYRAFFLHGWPRFLLTPTAMAALETAYARHGFFGIFVSRFFPGVRAAVTPFAGVVGLPPLRSLVPAAAASAIWYALLVLAGTTLGREWGRVRHVVETGTGVLGVVGFALATAFVVWVVRQRQPRP